MDDISELIFTGTGDSSHDRSVNARARRFLETGGVQRPTERSGAPLRRLHERVYTANLRDAPESIVQRNAWQILGALYPGLVISARSAAQARILKPPGDPDAPGWAFLTGPYRRNVSLPGLEVRIGEGPGPLPGDIPFLGLHLASPARHCLENLTPSRDRSGMSRTTGRKAVEDFLSRTLQTGGEGSVNEIRDKARALADALGARKQFEELDGLVAALLKSRDAARERTRTGRGTAVGEPFDPACIETLNALFSYLASSPMPHRVDPDPQGPAAVNTAFLEAYFSNHIEGTTFSVGEAEDIVFVGRIPGTRPLDGHDVLTTFRQLVDFESMQRRNTDFDAFLQALTGRHRALMGHRPDLAPGTFKTEVNRAGNTVFVAPELVKGTLRRGFEMLQGLASPFARGVFVHFLISQAHPFSDGNGRLARIFLANELVAGGLSRAVIPTVYADDYLGGLRGLSRRVDPEANFKTLDRAQRVTAAIVEPDRATCIKRWASTHAFVEPGADATLTDPDGTSEIVWRDGIPAPATYWEAQDDPDASFGM